MKKIIFTLVVLIARTSIYAQGLPSESDLFLYLEFNNSFEDESSFNRTPQIFNNPTFGLDRNSVASNSLVVTETDYLSFGSGADTEITNEITIAAWIKSDKVSENQKIISKDDLSNRNFTFHTISGTGTIMYGKWKNDVVYSVQSTTNVCDGNYHFIAGTDDGTTMKIYVDGVLEQTAPSTIGIDNDLTSLLIGRRGDNNLEYEGNIDKIMVYTKALPQTEISQLMNHTYSMQTSSVWNLSNNNIFYQDGTVAIGNSIFPSGYALAVDGKILTEEVKVQLSENWPDFVFENNYELRTLEEVERHIDENGHLPEIPSGDEVSENGINLGEMDAKLLQKIEELTLYLIEQNKKLESQGLMIENLQSEITALKNK